jgi:valyl-tRNA synthetase
VGRALKSDYGILPTQTVDYVVKPHSSNQAKRLGADEVSLKAALKAGSLDIDVDASPGKSMPGALSSLGSIYVKLEGVIDIEAEKLKLTGQLDEIDGNLSRCEAKLGNEGFVSKAPEEVVDRQKALKQELIERRTKVEHLLDVLTGTSS